MKALKIRFDTLPMAERKKYSALVQRKAFRLGYEWEHLDKKVLSPWKYQFNWLYFYVDSGFKRITSSEHEVMITRNDEIAQEISIDDFLALPEGDEFKATQYVLVRDFSDSTWRLDIFSHYDDGDEEFVCVGDLWKQCIPYKGNEHLVGTI